MKKSIQDQLREALDHQRALPRRPLMKGEWYGVIERGGVTAAFNRLPDAELWATTDFEGRGVRSTIEVVNLEVKEVAP